MLALTFANKEDYNKIKEDDGIDIVGLTSFAPEKPLTLTLNHSDGTKENITVNHTYNASQIEWFKAGSALNKMGENTAANLAAAKAATAKKAVPKKAKPVAKKAIKKVVKKATKKTVKKVVKAAKKKVVKKAAKKKAVKKSSKKILKKRK
jgi:aconitate hydratase